MRLQEALNKSVEEFGVEVLNEPRLINIIKDYHGFDDMPAARYILRVLMSDGYTSQIVNWEKISSLRIGQISRKLNQRYGFSEEMSTTIIRDFNYAAYNNGAYLLNNQKTDKLTENLSTEVSEEDYINSWADQYGVVYSADRKRLLKARRCPREYKIPNGVRVICNRAFEEKYMESIFLPNSIEHIGKLAFYNCKYLEKVIISEGLISIGDFAFFNCYRLHSINLPKSLKNLGKNPFVFSGIQSIKSLSNDIIVYYNGVFSGDKKVMISYFRNVDIRYNDYDVIFPEGLERIGSYAFGGEYHMRDINLPNGLTHIEDLAFYDCCFFSVKLPVTLTHIGDSAFKNCTDLRRIFLPQSLKHIGNFAFEGCDNLITMILPRNIESVGEKVFKSCSNMIIKIPKGRKSFFSKALETENWRHVEIVEY